MADDVTKREKRLLHALRASLEAHQMLLAIADGAPAKGKAEKINKRLELAREVYAEMTT